LESAPSALSLCLSRLYRDRVFIKKREREMEGKEEVGEGGGL
jgi:hypothetical protein